MVVVVVVWRCRRHWRLRAEFGGQFDGQLVAKLRTQSNRLLLPVPSYLHLYLQLKLWLNNNFEALSWCRAYHKTTAISFIYFFSLPLSLSPGQARFRYEKVNEPAPRLLRSKWATYLLSLSQQFRCFCPICYRGREIKASWSKTFFCLVLFYRSVYGRQRRRGPRFSRCFAVLVATPDHWLAVLMWMLIQFSFTLQRVAPK